MQEITLISSLQNRKKSRSKKQSWTRRNVWILLSTLSGVLLAVLGFLLLGIYSLTGANDALENYGGVALLIFAFIFFGVSAHFMDKTDENERNDKRSRIKILSKNNLIN